VAVLSSGVTSAIVASAWFHDPRTPYLLLDTRLRIRAVNAAYEQATAHPREQLLEELLFDAFPDNPADPAADGVAELSRSIDRVLRGGARSWMGFQRYDVPDLQAPGAFLLRIWAPVNAPVRERGRTVAVLHHVQDVTGPLRGPAPAGSAPPRPGLGGVAEELLREFPEVPREAVVGMLTHSELVVLASIGVPDVQRTAALARLRLEVRTGHPARTGTEVARGLTAEPGEDR
jgi:hypothetical protein